jgi:hypothetical protein
VDPADFNLDPDPAFLLNPDPSLIQKVESGSNADPDQQPIFRRKNL